MILSSPLPVVLIGCGAVSRLFYTPVLRALEAAGCLRVKAIVVPVVSPRLAREISAWRTEGVDVVPLLTGVDGPEYKEGAHGNYVLMSGALLASDRSKPEFLQKSFAAAWVRFKAIRSDARWIYTGRDYAFFDQPVASLAENLGLLDDESFRKILVRGTCAVLPIEHRVDGWRFSVPSRLISLIAAGVPIIAPPNAGTATGDFLKDHEGEGVIIVRNEDECLSALKKLFTEPEFRLSRHLKALERGKAFCPKVGRERFMAALSRVTASIRS